MPWRIWPSTRPNGHEECIKSIIESNRPFRGSYLILPPTFHTHTQYNKHKHYIDGTSRWREGQGRVRHNNQSANREHKTENSSLQYESCCLSVSLPAAAHTTTNHQISLRRHWSVYCCILGCSSWWIHNNQLNDEGAHDCKSAWLLGLISYSSSNNKYLAT